MAWDHQSGIRERLALLAEIGPSINTDAWRYNPRRDVWYESAFGVGRALEVRQEGVASLALIAERWTLSRVETMTLIDYPETPTACGAMVRTGTGSTVCRRPTGHDGACSDLRHNKG